MTQSDNSGVHVWSSASLRELVPPVDADLSPGGSEVEMTASESPGGSEVEMTASESPGGSGVEMTASESPGTDEAPTPEPGSVDVGPSTSELPTATEAAPTGAATASINTRSLDELERDLAAMAERLRAPATAEELVGSGPAEEELVGSGPVEEEPELSPADREHIAAAAALLEARRATGATWRGSEPAADAPDRDVADTDPQDGEIAAEAADPAALDLRDRSGDPSGAAAPDADEIDVRGPEEPPSATPPADAPPAGAPKVGARLAGESTLDDDAMSFVRDLASRRKAAGPEGRTGPVGSDVYDLGAAASAGPETGPAVDAATTPTPDPSPDAVFDLRTGGEPSRPTPPGPPLQGPSVDWEAIVTESDEPSSVGGATDDEAPVVTEEPIAAEVTAAEPEAVEVTTVDWEAVVGAADGAGGEAPGDRAGDVAPPPIASSPAHPPRIQAPDEPAAVAGPEPTEPPPETPFASSIPVSTRSTLARAALVTSLCADGLRDDDVAVLDGPAATALDELISGFDDELAPTLRAKTLRTDVVGESVPLAMGLASLPVASAPARRIFAVVDHVELEHGSSWAALDALGESSPTPPVLVVTVDPSEMRPDERPDRLVQRWARRLLDLGWRAVDLRYGREHRHRLERNDAGTEMTVLLDAEGLGERIAAGSLDVGGNDVDDLRWFWDVVHRSRRPTVAFVYISPPPAMPSESASSIAALADRLQREAPSAPRVPMLGLVRFDPEVHPASDTQAAVLDSLNGLVREDAAFRAATIVVSIGPCPLEMPEGAVVVEVGEEAAAVSLARAASALGRLPIVIGPDERMAGAALAMAPTAGSDAGDAVLIGLHAGIDGGSEVAAVRSRSVPAIAAATPRLEIVEPFATDWVDAQFRDALHRVDVGEGSTYFRVSRRPLPPSNVERARLGPALRRGGALLHRSLDDPVVVLVGVGHLVPVALDAAMKLESEGVGVDVVGIAIAERLREAGIEGSAPSTGLEQLIEAQRGHRLVVVLHDALGGLEWIGGATGLRAVSITPTGTDAPSPDEVVETAKFALTR